jgi:hypothetical protein
MAEEADLPRHPQRLRESAELGRARAVAGDEEPQVRVAPQLRRRGQQHFVRLSRAEIRDGQMVVTAAAAGAARIGPRDAVGNDRTRSAANAFRLELPSAAREFATTRARSDRPAAAARSAGALVGVQLAAAADRDRHARQRRGRQRETFRVEIARLQHGDPVARHQRAKLAARASVAGRAKPRIGNASPARTPRRAAARRPRVKAGDVHVEADRSSRWMSSLICRSVPPDGSS